MMSNKYKIHHCLTQSNLKVLLTVYSNDSGETWNIMDEYTYSILYCPYCGVKL